MVSPATVPSMVGKAKELRRGLPDGTKYRAINRAHTHTYTHIQQTMRPGIYTG